MSSSNLNIRIDDDLKHQAKAILDGYGISPSQAVKMLFLELVATRKFPLSLSYQAEYQPKEEERILAAYDEIMHNPSIAVTGAELRSRVMAKQEKYQKKDD